jgi:hypothetical protein
MRYFLVVIVLFLSLPLRAQEAVKVAARRVVLTRGTKGKDFKQAVVRYPVVTGLASRAAQSRTQTALSLKAAIGQSLDELRKEFRESWWLDEVDFTVVYNRHGLLDVEYTVQGTGAYPDGYTKHVVVNLKTGERLRARDLFTPSGLPRVVGLVDRAMQAEIRKNIQESARQGEDIRDQLKEARFQEKNVDAFSLDKSGITFYYDFGFPHVIKALEPEGSYRFPYVALKPYLRADSPLRVFVGRER